MAKSLLFVVHPGCAAVEYAADKEYGDYDAYLARLSAATLQRDVVVFEYMGNVSPLNFGNAEVINDMAGNGIPPDNFLDSLKSRGIKRMEVCGEFLWHYFCFDTETDMKNRKHFDGLAVKEQEAFVSKYAKQAKDDGLDPTPILNGMTGRTTVPGCVEAAASAIKSFVPVRIARELCYPATEPRQFDFDERTGKYRLQP